MNLKHIPQTYLSLFFFVQLKITNFESSIYREFSTGSTTSVNGILTALQLHTTIMEQGKNVLDSGFREIENEFDDLQLEIQGANDRNAQLSAVQRLANKIECTEDCFMSEEQAGAIIEGLNKNRDNIATVLSDVKRASSSKSKIVEKQYTSNKNR